MKKNNFEEVVIEGSKTYQSSHHEFPIVLINNPNPTLKTVQTHIIFLPTLCKASKNPRNESKLEITYEAEHYFLELFSLERYFNGYVGHKTVRDMEYFVQEVAKDCANALGLKVKVHAYIKLRGLNQEQVIDVEVMPDCS